jgi:YegS/Rv2252/BmrU family lipid kinase
MRLKTQVIVNPESDQGRTRKRWREIKEAIRAFIKEYRYEFTEKPFQAIEIARSAIKNGAEMIIGVGGDGTMNEIANGFYEDKKIINPKTTLGMVPSGTGCDFTRSLNIPKGLKSALKVITEAPSALIDVGKVTYRAYSGENEERYFLNISDFGIGGEVVRKVNQNRLERKASSYIRCLVSTMLHYRNKRLRIKFDGEEIPDAEYLVGVVANGRIFGKGMKIAPGARLDDGLFDIVLVKGMKFLEFCRHGWKIFLGSHLSISKVSLQRRKKIEALSEENEDVLLELDGEQLGKLPATYEIVPQSFLIKGYL